MSQENEDRDLRRMVDQLFTAGRPAADCIPALDVKLWAEVEDLGLSHLTASKSAGGGGASWSQLATVIASSARNAAYVPIVEHDVLAGWLLRAVQDDQAPSALDTFGFVSHDSAVVPWHNEAQTTVLLRRVDEEWHYARIRPGDVPAAAVAGVFPRHRLMNLSSAQWSQVDACTGRELIRRGALARAVQMAASMEAVVQLTAKYVGVRKQFGRALVRFQAVQKLIADMAAESALASAAVRRAVDAFEDDGGASLEIAIAKSCTGHATEIVARAAHQAHGAIGTTKEYQLHRYVGALYAWRTEFGGAATWDHWLTHHVLTAQMPTDALWSAVTGADLR